MLKKRWQAPPMQTPKAAPKFTVDALVVNKVLEMNPAMRNGRTTLEVMRAVEASIAGGARESQGRSVVSRVESAPQSRASDGAAALLDSALDFFLRGQAEGLARRLDDIEQRRRALEREADAAREGVAADIVGFVALLDPVAVRESGDAALAKHAPLLSRAGLSTQQVFERAAAKRRRAS